MYRDRMEWRTESWEVQTETVQLLPNKKKLFYVIYKGTQKLIYLSTLLNNKFLFFVFFRTSRISLIYERIFISPSYISIGY